MNHHPQFDTDVAVIGAGPYGLSATVKLRRAGVDTRIFGQPMSFWRSMPIGMKLRSNLSATNIVETGGPLSLRTFGEQTGQAIVAPVPLAQFIQYGLWVQRHGVPDLDQRQVVRLARAHGGFRLTLDDGEELSARRAVVACGISRFAHRPPAFDHLPAAAVSHTGEHHDLSKFADQRVAVIGGGQSAFECAALMAERGAEVEVLARSEDVVWLRGMAIKTRLGPLGPIVYAPTDVGPLWYSRLISVPDLFRRLPREWQERIAHRAIRPACSHFVRVRLDGVTISLGVSVTGADANQDGIRLECTDGSDRHVDHLMLGTGYRVDVTKYPFLDRGLLDRLRRTDGYPLLARGLESSVPGLHIIGAPAAWSFGPTLRFVSGSWYASRAVADAIKGQAPFRSVALAATAIR
jgi:hypothetical protein